MSRTPSIATLEARRADLLAQVKQLDQAIKFAREKEAQKKQKAILDAMAARGLLDHDLEKILAAIQNIDAPEPESEPAQAPGTEPSADSLAV